MNLQKKYCLLSVKTWALRKVGMSGSLARKTKHCRRLMKTMMIWQKTRKNYRRNQLLRQGDGVEGEDEGVEVQRGEAGVLLKMCLRKLPIGNMPIFSFINFVFRSCPRFLNRPFCSQTNRASVQTDSECWNLIQKFSLKCTRQRGLKHSDHKVYPCDQSFVNAFILTQSPEED